jgi:hypothetical protein
MVNEIYCPSCLNWHRYIWEPGLTCSCHWPLPEQGWTEEYVKAFKAEQALTLYHIKPLQITNRCDCGRWHTYSRHPKNVTTCICGLRLPPIGGLDKEEIKALRAEEELVAQWMRANNDMEGSCFLGRGKYD